MGKKMIGYKGFDKNWSCNGHKYEVGKEYEHNGPVKLCKSGFHFCENPLDVLSYYPLASGNNYGTVEADKVSDEKSNDSNRVCSKINIVGELKIPDLISAAVKFIFERAARTKGAAATTGERSNAEVKGAESIACGLGSENKARGSKNCWIVLTERDDCGKIKTVKTAKVDGKKIKADIWYQLKGGKFVEAKC